MPAHTCPLIATPPKTGIVAAVMGEGKPSPDRSFGKFHAEIVCPLCKGSGTCPTCGGAGEIETGGESG